MNQEVRIPLGLRARTLDFYVAFLVFFMGAYAFIDPTWPERFDSPIYWIVLIEDVYLCIASLMIMLSLIVREKKKCKMKILIPSIIGEAYGWFFIAAAATVIAVTAWIIPPSAFMIERDYIEFIWFVLWVGLAISSFMRYMDLKKHYKIRSITK